MSKYESQKKNNKLKVIIKAEDLLCHTFNITDNVNVFPKRHRLTFTNKIVNTALEIYTNLCMAEELFPDNYDLYVRRKNYQKTAMAACRTLNELINVAMRMYHLPKEKAGYWSKMVTDVRNMTVSWAIKDQERFKHLKP